jgi:hypothetical protein
MLFVDVDDSRDSSTSAMKCRDGEHRYLVSRAFKEAESRAASTRGVLSMGQTDTSYRADEKPPIAPNGSLVYLSNEVSSCGALMPRVESNRCLDSNAPEATIQIQ